MRSVILISLLLCSCAKVRNDPRQGSGIHEDFKPYVTYYEDEFNTRVFDIPVTYKKLEGEFIGKCYRWTSGLSEIFIDPGFWETATDLQRKALIIHEMGHCHMWEDHRNFFLNDNCRGSIMDEYQPSLQCLQKHWDYYMEEMR